MPTTVDERGCVLQFAKAPLPGRVKTRLAADIGAEAAAELAKRLTERVARDLGSLPPGWSRRLCVDDPSHPLFLRLARAAGAPPLPQGDGDLGARMRRGCEAVLAAWPAAIVVGSDCTGYDPAYLAAATAALDDGADAVLGPALDGGYVLVGFRSSVPPGVLEGIAWGGDQVAAMQRERFRARSMRWVELPPRADIDRVEDLASPGLP